MEIPELSLEHTIGALLEADVVGAALCKDTEHNYFHEDREAVNAFLDANKWLYERRAALLRWLLNETPQKKKDAVYEFVLKTIKERDKSKLFRESVADLLRKYTEKRFSGYGEESIKLSKDLLSGRLNPAKSRELFEAWTSQLLEKFNLSEERFIKWTPLREFITSLTATKLLTERGSRVLRDYFRDSEGAYGFCLQGAILFTSGPFDAIFDVNDEWFDYQVEQYESDLSNHPTFSIERLLYHPRTVLDIVRSRYSNPCVIVSSRGYHGTEWKDGRGTMSSLFVVDESENIAKITEYLKRGPEFVINFFQQGTNKGDVPYLLRDLRRVEYVDLDTLMKEDTTAH